MQADNESVQNANTVSNKLRERISTLPEGLKERLLQTFSTISQQAIHINSRLLSYQCYEVEIVFHEVRTYGYGSSEAEAKDKSMIHFVTSLMENSSYSPMMLKALEDLNVFPANPSNNASATKKKDFPASTKAVRSSANASMDLNANGPVYYTQQTEASPRVLMQNARKSIKCDLGQGDSAFLRGSDIQKYPATPTPASSETAVPNQCRTIKSIFWSGSLAAT